MISTPVTELCTVVYQKFRWPIRYRARLMGWPIASGTLNRVTFTPHHFGRVHQALRVTPAMEAGIAEHVRSLRRQSAQLRADRVIVKRIPTHIGDVLILETTQSYTIYGVGKVSKDDQQDFGSQTAITYADDRASAVIQAKGLVAQGSEDFLQKHRHRRMV
jgi:hypothetical protein